MDEKRKWDLLNAIHKTLCLQEQALEVLVMEIAGEENRERFLVAKKKLLGGK